MLRSHELATEIRYSMTPWQFGIHAMLDFERVGSSAGFLGAPNEVSDSVRNVEQVVPWFQWRIPGTYIANPLFTIADRNKQGRSPQLLHNVVNASGGPRGFHQRHPGQPFLSAAYILNCERDLELAE